MYANRQVEQMNIAQLRNLQFERLKKQIKWAAEKSSFYQRRFAAAKVTVADIKSLADIEKLPLLDSNALYQTNPLDILALPLSALLRFNVTIDDDGPVIDLYTNGDIARNVEMMTRALVAAGINNASVVALQGNFADSRILDLQYALEMIGATVVQMGNDYKQWMYLQEIVRCDTFISTPQLMLQLFVQLRALGKDISQYELKTVICVNPQGVNNILQRHIANTTRGKVYNLYAPRTLGTASMLYQCEAQSGYHIQEDCFYPEIVAFNSDEVIKELHVMGELVVTSLVAEAMPLIRYRTGQAVILKKEPCSCGRTFMRVTMPYTSEKKFN